MDLTEIHYKVVNYNDLRSRDTCNLGDVPSQGIH
jgi:hypothetical protein